MSESKTLRVAVVGSGPAGFYTAEALLRGRPGSIEIDLFERLPAPFGLLRSGVAPDHQRIKQAAKAFERTAQSPGFRFLGNVEVGRDVSVEELRARYDQVVFATGSTEDRLLGVAGEELRGVHSALSFVGWYNGHPDFRNERFDLGVERALVIGAGNVALDVVRLLVRRPEELGETDIAGYALDALHESRVREVVLLARRGPAEAAFAQSELSDIAELEGVQVTVDPAVIAQARAQEDLDSTQIRLLDYLAELASAPERDARRRVYIEFLGSPLELLGEGGRVRAVRVEKNALSFDDFGRASARGTGEEHVIDAGLVLRAIGFSGLAIAGLPFDTRRGIVPNADGRVLDDAGSPIPGLYVVGWIKRGPRGLIGANKGDASQTAAAMLEDAAHATGALAPRIDGLLSSRALRVVSFDDWRKLDELERAAGRERGKVREKFTTIEAMLQALDAVEP